VTHTSVGGVTRASISVAASIKLRRWLFALNVAVLLAPLFALILLIEITVDLGSGSVHWLTYVAGISVGAFPGTSIDHSSLQPESPIPGAR
jgi:hypothetical protein